MRHKTAPECFRSPDAIASLPRGVFTKPWLDDEVDGMLTRMYRMSMDYPDAEYERQVEKNKQIEQNKLIHEINTRTFLRAALDESAVPENKLLIAALIEKLYHE